MKFLLSSLLLSLSSLPALAAAGNAQATLTSPASKTFTGKVQISETKQGITITAEASGLKPGAVHGFHVHETGECKGPDFKSAGGHFNPEKQPHSGPAAHAKHLGDLGNLVANTQGMARTEVFIPAEKSKAMSSIIGKSVIIHAKADDMTTQPSGDSGDRIACGIIEATKS